MANLLERDYELLAEIAIVIMKWRVSDPDFSDNDFSLACSHQLYDMRRASCERIMALYPEMKETFDSIIEHDNFRKILPESMRNSINISHLALELEELSKLIGKITSNEYWLLIISYMSLLNNHNGISGTDYLTETEGIITALSEFETFSVAERVLLAISLWLSDYRGFRSRVNSKIAFQRRTYSCENHSDADIVQCADTEAEIEKRFNGVSTYIEKNINRLVSTGVAFANACGTGFSTDSIYHVSMCMYEQLCVYRQQVAEEIAERHPEFSVVSRLIADHNAIVTPQTPGETIASWISQEMDRIVPFYSDADWYDDPDFLSLVLAYGSWGFKNDREQMEHAIATLFAMVNKHYYLYPGAEFMLIIAMWFWDYYDYQAKFMALANPTYNIETGKIQNLAEQEEIKEQIRRKEYQSRGVCQYCGGAFKGIIRKTCVNCGRVKDY